MTVFLKSIIHNTPMLGGAVFCFIILIIFYLFKLDGSEKLSKRLEYYYDYGTISFFMIYIATGFIYLFYPNYLNHVEPIVASLGVVIKNGDPLYPMPVGVYPYNGSIYGPALFEIQAVFQWISGVSIITKSKLPGLLALIISAIILMRINRSWLYRGYLLYLFPFGIMLFWNRAEPFLIMIVSLSLFVGKNYEKSRYLPVLMGVLGGMASALKIHGVAYVFTAYLAVAASSFSISAILLFSISAILSFSAFFLPHNVMFSGFWGYLKFAGNEHGLSFRLWMENLAYLIFLLFPIILLGRNATFERLMRFRMTLILIIVLLITIIASKHGNGFYHLLPLIPVNAFMMQRLSRNIIERQTLIKVIYASLIAVSFVVVLMDFVFPMTKSWRQFDYAQKELVSFEKRYPDIIMGVTDEHGYPYSFLRAMLSKRQIDYAAYMDLQVSGIKDEGFAEKMKNCEIYNMLVPNTGKPFSLNNYYTLKPLFSDNVRELFREKYNLSKRGIYYSVFTCSNPAGDSSQNIIDR